MRPWSGAWCRTTHGTGDAIVLPLSQTRQPLAPSSCHPQPCTTLHLREHKSCRCVSVRQREAEQILADLPATIEASPSFPPTATFPAPARLPFAAAELFLSLAVPGLPAGGLRREGCQRLPAAVFEQLAKDGVG